MEERTLFIENGTIVTGSGQFEGNLLIENGRIAAITAPGERPPVSAYRVIDAVGRHLLPGCVDEHTHMMDPGHTEREDFTSGTRAAAYGGVTTVVDHHRTVPAVYSAKELKEKIEYLKHRSVVDFGLKGGISPDNTEDLEAMWDMGITGFKTFTCDLHGVRAMYPGILYRAFSEVARFGGNVLIHCEDDSVCAVEEEILRAQGRVDYASQLEWRNELAEEIAVKSVVAVAKRTGVRLVVAHVSQATLLREIHYAHEEGYPIYAESCPHYFRLTEKDVADRGPWMKFTPPPRSEANQEEMWRLFNLGYVATIGSDHCPYPYEQKKPGEKNIWDAPNGIPGVETSLRLMLDAVNLGKTALPNVVRAMCECPARLEGLYPRKGTLQVGSDADVLIVDMEKKEEIRNENVISKCKWSPYDGWTLQGAPETVLVRGRPVVENYEIVGEPGYGEFVARVGN